MKKIMVMSMLIAAFMFTACAQKNNKKEDTEMSKTLVAYFSASGVTKNVAEQLATVLNADLHEIKPQQPYTDADLDWTNKQSRSTVEMQDKNSRPAIGNKVENFGEYSTIYIGFPIWWYTAPTIINTFLESNDFSGKQVILFATSGSSDITRAVNDLKAKYPNINIKGGKLLNSHSEKQLKDFVNQMK